MRWFVVFLPLLLPAQSGAAQDRLLDAIHHGDAAGIRAALEAGANPNAPGPLGITPLMRASAYATVDCVRLLIEAGASVNASSEEGFTPLMWSLSGPAKVRFLLARGADAKARSKSGATALILARQNGLIAAIPHLLAAGSPDEDGMSATERPLLSMSPDLLLQTLAFGSEPRDLSGGASPVYAAVNLAGAGASLLRTLLDAGLAAEPPLAPPAIELSALSLAAHFRNHDQVRLLLARGANPNTRGRQGMTPLMAAAAAEHQHPSVLAALLAGGASMNAQDDLGRTALDWALLQGETPASKFLRQRGAKSLAPSFQLPVPVEVSRTPRQAIETALRTLLPAGPGFFRKSPGCISCHNNSLPSIAAHLAIQRGLDVDSSLAAHASKAALATWRPREDTIAVGATSVPGLLANFTYQLWAFSETRYPPNPVTSAAALALSRLQRSDGSWSIPDTRPPLGTSDIKWTALAARGIRDFLPPGLQPQEQEIRHKARRYLQTNPARSTEDQVFLLLGLDWTGASHREIAAQRRRLLRLQRRDGGWSQLPTMPSDAYATAQALYALSNTGLPARTAAYQRGAAFLLRNQLPDGSWFVRTRAIGFQPHIETGFPHGPNQFLSAAATAWSVIALVPALDATSKAR